MAKSKAQAAKTKKAAPEKNKSAERRDSTERRPSSSSELPPAFIQAMAESFTGVRNELENFSAHLSALDRKRLNGVSVRKLGFIGRALLLAAENPEFLPHWLSLQKFQADNNYFLALHSVYDVTRQIEEILWNIILETSDTLYTDALEYYAQVSDAAKRRIDPAEMLHADLKTFFERPTMRKGEEPTEKQLKRDFDALLKGRKNGEMLIENIGPKTQGGRRKVIDESYKDSAAIKESKRGEIDE